MAVAFRSDNEVTNGTAGTSVTVSKPASIVDTGDNPDRDHLIAIIAAAGAPSITPPADWNLVDTVASGSAVTMWVYEKLASSEGASWTWTLGSSLRNWGWVGAYTGVDPDDPISGGPHEDSTLTSSLTLDAGGSVAPAGAYIMAVAATRTASGAATTWTVADAFDGLTVNERADVSTNAGAGTDICGAVGDALWTQFYTQTLGSTATASQTQTAGVAEFVALRPYFVPYTGDLAGTGLVIEAAFDVDPDSDSSDWTWTDLTADGHEPGRVTMRHGRANRATVADPSEARFTLLNLAGKYTSPTGAYAAKMIRNLPLRIRLNGFGTSVGGLGYHRGTFFLASMTPRWDASTNFAVVDIVASGRLRRIQQRDEPVHSAAYTAIQRMPSSSGYTAPVAHWPCEDESGSTKAASAVAGVAAAIVSNVEFGAGAGPTGSAPLMVMSASTTFDAPVPAYPATGTWTVMFATMVPDETGVETGLLAWRTTGTAALWRVSIAPGAPSALHLRVYNTAGAQILDTSVSVTESTFYTFPQFIRLEATQDGTGVDYELSYESADDGSGLTGTLAANTSGNVTTFTIGAQPGLADIVMGHIALHTQPGANGLFTTTAVLDANAGEWPWARFGRLCQEQNIPYINRASDNQDLEMGPQQAASFMQLIREAETVEGCVIHDSGGISNFGLLSFPARDDRENIDAALTLDMAQSQVAQPFTPILDDQDIANDVEVSRVGGSSARVEDDASIARDGRYRQQVTVNTENDLYLADLAGWRVNLGTVAGMRFPSVSWNMRHPNSVTLAESWVAMTLFQRLDILNPPSQYPPDDIRTILEGFTETISADTWTVTANLSPYDPNHVFVLAETSSDTDQWLGRLTGDADCALRTAIDSDDTAIVFDPNCYRLTTTADDFPLDVRLGGEVVTLSGIATTAATYVAAGAMSTQNNAAVTPALYAGATANDLICVVARIRAASAGTLTTPDGYTRVPLGTWTEADEMQLYVKVHTGSESNPTVTPTGGSAGDTVSAVTFGLRNMPITLTDLADLVVASQTLTNSSAQNIIYPGLVPKRDGAPIDGCVVLLFGGKDDDWTSVAAVSGFTEALDSSSTTGNDQGLVIDYVIQTTATSIGSGSFTVTGGASAVSSAAIVALAGGYQTGTASARSVNGVVKSHAVGTVIEVEDPGVLSM